MHSFAPCLATLVISAGKYRWWTSRSGTEDSFGVLAVVGSGTFMIRHLRARKTIQGGTSFIFLSRWTLSVNGSPLRGNWLPLCYPDAFLLSIAGKPSLNECFWTGSVKSSQPLPMAVGVDRTIVRNDLLLKVGGRAWQQWLAAKADEIQHLHCYVGVLSTHKRVFFYSSFFPRPRFRWEFESDGLVAPLRVERRHAVYRGCWDSAGVTANVVKNKYNIKLLTSSLSCWNGF